MPATRSSVFVALAALALALTWSAAAVAHHRTDHAQGPPVTAAASGPTEDTDSDGVTNAPDPVGDADNRHPSGKDKHVEAGGSGNQGNAASEPDANGHGPERDAGGRDQPGGPGGLDVLDQDGNNGCGNDDDFEDDNEGLCLGNVHAPGQQVEEAPEIVTSPTVVSPSTEVSGEVAAGAAGDTVGNQVLEVAADEEGPAAAALAFTGTDLVPLLGVALGLALLGAGLMIFGRHRT
jgi:hypothetical protein